jgi:hypothetical protein
MRLRPASGGASAELMSAPEYQKLLQTEAA